MVGPAAHATHFFIHSRHLVLLLLLLLLLDCLVLFVIESSNSGENKKAGTMGA